MTKLQAESLALNSSRERVFFYTNEILYGALNEVHVHVLLSCCQNEGRSQCLDMTNKFFENVVKVKCMGKLHARIN